jgi:2-keto-4-pentenoate hydratase
VYDSGVSLARVRDGMIAPRLEAELAFVLERPLRGPDVGLEDVLAATGSVLPMFEIVDSRIDDWRVGIVDTIADNASGWGVVLGPPMDVDPRALDTIDVVFERVGDETLTGTGDAVLGHPANAVAWLANTLAEFGEELPAGEPILSGSFTRVLEATPGQYRARFGGGVGDVELTIEEDAA